MKAHIPQKSEQQFSTTVKTQTVSSMQLTLSDCGELQGASWDLTDGNKQIGEVQAGCKELWLWYLLASYMIPNDKLINMEHGSRPKQLPALGTSVLSRKVDVTVQTWATMGDFWRALHKTEKNIVSELIHPSTIFRTKTSSVSGSRFLYPPASTSTTLPKTHHIAM